MSRRHTRLTREAIDSAHGEFCNAFPGKVDAIYVPQGKVVVVRHILAVMGLKWEVRAAVDSFPWFLSGEYGNLLSAPKGQRMLRRRVGPLGRSTCNEPLPVMLAYA